MQGSITFKLILKSKEYDIPFQFKGLTDVHPNIYKQLLLNSDHKYLVESKVKDDIFKSFIDFWVNGTIPGINIIY